MNKLLSTIITITSITASSNLFASHNLYSCAEPSQESIAKINQVLNQTQVINNNNLHCNSVHNQGNYEYHMTLETIQTTVRPKEFLEYTPAAKTFAKNTLMPKIENVKEMISKITFKIEDVSLMGTWVALNLKPDLTSLNSRQKALVKNILPNNPHLSIAKFDMADNSQNNSARLLIQKLRLLINKTPIKLSFDKACVYAPCLIDQNNGAPIYQNKRIVSA